MPSLLAPFKKEDGNKDVPDKDFQVAQQSRSVTSEAALPPPAYAAAPENGDSLVDPPLQDVGVEITAGFSNLYLDSKPKDPDADTCLAHLKLLFAIQTLKEDIGYTDGLWNIWDSRPDLDFGYTADIYPPGSEIRKLTPEDKKKLSLAKIREKRWALFVARAVDRYEAWWSSLPRKALVETDMSDGQQGLYHSFVSEKHQYPWSREVLLPLDVLMVFHAHMLNPRAFLEDTLRLGLSTIWASGMPWMLVSAAIDSNFSYEVSDQAKANWVNQTGCNWDNVEDSPSIKAFKCPACECSLEIPWTTCGHDESLNHADTVTDLVGHGYGDGDFNFACTDCNIQITKKLLSVAKFIKDARLLTVNHIPMPGTVLDPISGKPEAIPRALILTDPRTFPNRMVSRKLMAQISDLIKPSAVAPPDMDTIRGLIEMVTSSGSVIREIEGYPAMGRGRLSPKARISVRKMMSRYWDNFSPFALDLAGAVMRQSIFTQKMHQIDWLHSPSCRETMARLITKYGRFIAIMAEHPGKTCVPTLDVDLAWHTHQLSPREYYKYTTQKTFKFTDHDDKIEDDKLSDAFEWTMKTYQDKYHEVYSECTCWYCETIRAANTGTVSRILGVSNQERAATNFIESGRAQLCPPDKSAHISAHNAVRSQPHSSAHQAVNQYRIQRQQRQLEANYAKACKRAQKKGRTLPPRDEYYNHWGYSYYMYSPYVWPLYFTPGIYYGSDPGFVNTASTGWAACASGSCGAGVASGACGGAGGCGASGAGGISCGGGGSGGCSGGGGGGCGGGGGGGCGGGGGS